ncbi:MAG TPA: hypothetical protein IGS52_03700 [Oscillatoriaceae cyanobacterium M33_DOE_052]|uniref:Alpha/beta hydrolase n=1 Tax=Planktothricoides sp. SpSt-374 TaxID=2282167 RepID=A0A7C3VMW2_9CYAN|nr:hypothetical protein [Oscillatoriaceae cyanobacterium M33_DOE_052]
MTLVICPGVHEPSLTARFIASVGLTNYAPQWRLLVFPAAESHPYSPAHVLQFLQSATSGSQPPLTFVSFSAGVVGAMGAAWGWQLLGGEVRAFIALDGWGVPVSGKFPIHRISHDYFTHWSSALLGSGGESFYAEPGVAHLDLWRSPHTTPGFRTGAATPPKHITAAAFILHLLEKYHTFED